MLAADLTAGPGLGSTGFEIWNWRREKVITCLARQVAALVRVKQESGGLKQWKSYLQPTVLTRGLGVNSPDTPIPARRMWEQEKVILGYLASSSQPELQETKHIYASVSR